MAHMGHVPDRARGRHLAATTPHLAWWWPTEPPAPIHRLEKRPHGLRTISEARPLLAGSLLIARTMFDGPPNGEGCSIARTLPLRTGFRKVALRSQAVSKRGNHDRLDPKS